MRGLHARLTLGAVADIESRALGGLGSILWSTEALVSEASSGTCAAAHGVSGSKFFHGSQRGREQGRRIGKEDALGN